MDHSSLRPVVTPLTDPRQLISRWAGTLATAAYLLMAIGMTWPLASVMTHEIAADLGDPVFNCWVLLWTGGQVLAFLSGDVTALNRYWHGNIFAPEPLTIAYSEHLAPQMVQALPLMAVTDNIVFIYNLLFLSTFVLSGLGMFLMVRQVTGRPVAAFVAGVAFAFAPYRFAQLSHLQVLSAQWMPFVLYGFRRYLDTGRRRALAGGTAALIAQNLSCGYYLLFYAPFAGAYALYELYVRGRLRDWAAWKAFAGAALVTGLVTLPFLMPYLDVRTTGVGVRDLGEIQRFSADTHAFATPPAASVFWYDRLAGFPKPEGEGFPGASVLVLALIGVLAGSVTRIRIALREAHTSPPWKQVLQGVVLVLLVAHVLATISWLTMGVLRVPIGLMEGGATIYRLPGSVFLRTAVLLIGWWGLTRQHGGPKGLALRQPEAWGFFFGAAVVAGLLALGPQIEVGGRAIAQGPYAWLMAYVPGFDGLRVPARYLMLVSLFLAVLAGLGASALMSHLRRVGAVLAMACAGMMLVEAWPGTFPTNVRLDAGRQEFTPRVLHTGDDIAPVYKALRDSSQPLILFELPFGNPAWDIQAVFYAGYHRRKLVNGYSGFFPESQQRMIRLLRFREDDPDAAWRGLLATGATQVLVHMAAFTPEEGQALLDWLARFGGREILVDGTDHLFAIR